MDPIFSAGFDMPAPQPRGGMFGGSNTKDALMAAVAGFMSRRNPQMSNGIMQMMMQKQHQAQEEAQFEHRRQQQMQDQMAMYDYKLAHPGPGQGSEFERVAEAGGYAPGTSEYHDLMKRKADAMANPIVMTPYGPMPYSQVVGSQNRPSVGAVMDDPRKQGGAGAAVPPPGF
jgi:hypothetical protein